MSDLTLEIEKIKERNNRVELDKAWEVSWTRRIFICVLTYMVASAWLYVINETSIFLKAVIPSVGYVLSTLSIPIVRKIWLRYKVEIEVTAVKIK